MAWWGKIIGGGFGFILGGPLGALIGGALGHQFDRGLNGLEQLEHSPLGDQERTQAAFFTACFSVMGHLAKVDGQVSRDEIRMAERVMTHMQLDAGQRKAAIELFTQGKAAAFPLDEVLEQFRRECRRRRNLLQMFLEILITTALADGELHPQEHQALVHIAKQIGFHADHLEQLIQMVLAQQQFAGQGQHPAGRKDTLKDAYAVLGVEPNAADDEIKKAYRRLISQHHPDKLVSRGLPEEMIKLASEKTHEIKQAYDTIRAARARAA